METSQSQWVHTKTPPWLKRLGDGRSSASSGAESDTEGSGTENEKCEVKREAVDSTSLTTQRRITELDQQKEELKIELQLEVALLQGELQMERERLHKHTERLQILQGNKQRQISNIQQERAQLEKKRIMVEEMKNRWMERQKDPLTQSEEKTNPSQMQQEKEALDSAVRAFEDWEFRILEQESAVEEERTEGETEISREQQAVQSTQERVIQLEQQLHDTEREKEREMTSLRQERRDLLHLTQQELLKDRSVPSRRRSSHRKPPERPMSVQGEPEPFP